MTRGWIIAWRIGALSAVAAVAVANVFHTARNVAPPPIDPPAALQDPITQRETRLARFRANAQARGLRGTIGYVGDPAGGSDEYFHAQFALVPLVVDFDPAPHEWAVADLRPPPDAPRVPAGWRVVEDCGEGVLLLRKSTQ
jgi:hypothetical protein